MKREAVPVTACRAAEQLFCGHQSLDPPMDAAESMGGEKTATFQQLVRACLDSWAWLETMSRDMA